MSERKGLDLYVVYSNPRDFPGKHVIRRQFATASGIKAFYLPHCVVDTLEEARATLPPGLVCIARDQSDDPVIVESWI